MSKMSSPRYDFVGVSSTQLPYVHDSFPAGPKMGTVKYCTMRSVNRGSDTFRRSVQRTQSLREGNKEISNLKLPKLDFDMYHGVNHNRNWQYPGVQRKTVDISSTTGNIYKQKAYFRLKGIPINQVYSLHRTKTDRFEDYHSKTKSVVDDLKKNPSVQKHLRKFPSINLGDRTPTESMIDTVTSTETEDSDLPLRKSRLQEMDRESPVPGVRVFKKSRQGRKLGNIVSSRRLQQLLDNSDPIDLGAFYYY